MICAIGLGLLGLFALRRAHRRCRGYSRYGYGWGGGCHGGGCHGGPGGGDGWPGPWVRAVGRAARPGWGTPRFARLHATPREEARDRPRT